MLPLILIDELTAMSQDWHHIYSSCIIRGCNGLQPTIDDTKKHVTLIMKTIAIGDTILLGKDICISWPCCSRPTQHIQRSAPA